MDVFCDRTKNRLQKFVRVRTSKFRWILGIRSCVQGRRCATVTEQKTQRKSRSLLARHGNNFRSDLLPGASCVNCGGEVLVIGPHLLSENAQGYLQLNLREDEGQEEVLELKMKKRRKVKLMKRSRKSERTPNSCMRHGDDHGMECDANTNILSQCAMCKG